MARGYKATLEVKCWKEHTCCYCGAAYRYLLDRQQTGGGATQADAVNAARANAVRALRNAVELYPCPACGRYQPDMIGRYRSRRHAMVLVAALGAWTLLFVLSSVGWLPAPVSLWLLILCVVPTWLGYTWYGASNPNRSLRANKALAEQLVQQKHLELVAAANERDDRPRPIVLETGPGYWCVFLLLAATILLMPGAEWLRLGSSQWPVNPGWHPPSFGPGDTAWTWVEPEKPLQTPAGEWRFIHGSASVSLPEDNGNKQQPVEKVPLGVSSRDEPLRPVQADEPLRTPRLWVRLHFPKNHKLSHRKVRVELALNLAVPNADGPDRETRQEVTAIVEAHLARPFAAFLYRFLWNIAMYGGGALFLLAGVYHLLLDAALRRAAPPTRVTAIAEDGTRESAATADQPTATA